MCKSEININYVINNIIFSEPPTLCFCFLLSSRVHQFLTVSNVISPATSSILSFNYIGKSTSLFKVQCFVLPLFEDPIKETSYSHLQHSDKLASG